MEKVNGEKANVIRCASLPEAFASVAMTYPEKDMEPGKLARFSTNGRPDDLAGWCKLFADGMGAAFGCDREDTSFIWQQRDCNARPLNKQERQAEHVNSDQVRQQAAAALAAQQANAAKVAIRTSSDVVLLPSFADGRDGGDFNDLRQAEGLDAVQLQPGALPDTSSREIAPFFEPCLPKCDSRDGTRDTHPLTELGNAKRLFDANGCCR